MNNVIDINTKEPVGTPQATPLPTLSLYEVTCTPVIDGKLLSELGPSGQQQVVYRLIVAANSSTEASRKIVNAFKSWYPAVGITAMDAVSLTRITHPDTALVIV